MAKRSVQITLVNNTPFMLTYYQDMLCHGSYSVSPPPTVASHATVQWESHDEFISFEGTEGWVKYTCPQTTDLNNPTSELVFIYWDNPYFPTNFIPLDFKTSVSDIDTNTQGHTSSPYCSTATPLIWPQSDPGTFSNIVAGTATVTDLFLMTTDGATPFDPGSGGTLVWNVITAFLGSLPVWLNALSQDLNWSFTLGLRQNGSVAQSIRHFYDGKQGLLALAVKAQQPSLRKLFGM